MSGTTLWGSQVVIRISSAAPDADPVWVDVSDYVTFRVGEIEASNGQQTDIGGGSEGSDPAAGQLGLRNDDHRFSTGNTSSPYHPWFKEARRIQVVEVVDGVSFVIIDGYLGTPVTTPSIDPADGVTTFLTTTCTITDRLSRLRSARRFISTIAAHVLGSLTATVLRAYFPLGESTGVRFSPAVGSVPALVRTQTIVSNVATNASLDLFAPAGGGVIFADDLTVLRFAPQMIVGSPATALVDSRLVTDFNSDPVAANSVISVAAWVNPDPVGTFDSRWLVFELGFGTGLAGGILRIRRTDATETPGGVWHAFFSDTITAAWSATAFGVHAASKPTLLAVRVNLQLNTMSLFVDDVEYPAVVTGTMATSGLLLGLTVGGGYTGAMGHVQVYVGTQSVNYDFTAHKAQLALGRFALERQLTGARVATILDYAGFPGGIRDLDPGTAAMSRVSMAGKGPADLLEEARRTERGRLFMDSGRIQFHDRVHVFNV